MIFRQLFDEETWTYTYLIGDTETGEAVLIDPVNTHIQSYSKLLNGHGLTLKYSLETHVHADHVTAGGLLRQRFGARTAVSGLCGADCADLHIGDNDVIRFGAAERIRVIATPGHTSGSVSFLWRDRVFTGDALLINGCGRTDFQGGDAGTLYDSITRRLFTLPDDVLVYPGHDYNGRRVSNIAEEKTGNSRLAGRDRDAFIALMDGLDLPAPRLINESVPANRACGLPESARHDALRSQSNPKATAVSNPAEPAHARRTEDLVRQAKGCIDEIDVDTARRCATDGKHVVIDVREPAEFEAGALPDAINLPRGVLEFRLSDIDRLADRSAPVLVYCRSGGRAALAVQSLQTLGYSNVSSLAGGYQAWMNG